MKGWMRRRLVAALVVLAAGAFTGGALAARHDPKAGTDGFVRQVAKRMDVTPSQLRASLRRRPHWHPPYESDPPVVGAAASGQRP